MLKKRSPSVPSSANGCSPLYGCRHRAVKCTWEHAGWERTDTIRSAGEAVSRAYRLPLSKVHAAKKAIGAATASETIERALDLVVFQRERICY
jgi:hypothetical protein